MREELGKTEELGLALEDISYTPISLPGKVLQPPYENRKCKGLRIRILQKEKFLSVRFALSIIKALKKNHATKLSPQAQALNRHFGDDILVHYLTGNISFETMMANIVADEKSFLARRQKYLLYE
jgi:uncharacterized protein YbbC (DUF1343 family)